MFKPTPDQREQVSWYASCGQSQESIACRIGIAKKTLTEHFAIELTIGKEAKRCERLDLLVTAAKSGNVAAIKELGVIQTHAVLQESFNGDESSAPDKKPEKLGKKEVAQKAADGAGRGTDWDQDLDPDFVLAN